MNGESMDANGMTIKDLAEYLNLPQETLYKYVRAGSIPARKHGKRWIFDREEIDRWIVEHGNEAEKAGRAKVLVVDDDASVRRVLRLWLEKDGYSVEEAGNGKEGLDAVQRGKFDLVFLDLEMPIMTGVEALVKIKALEDVPPVVIVTGYYDSTMMEDVLAMGPIRVLKKPVDRKSFLAVAESYTS